MGYAQSMYVVVAFTIAVHAAFIGSKIAVSLYALNLGASQVTIGMLAALYAVVPLALGVYSGRLADTRGTRWPLIGGAAAMCTGMVVSMLSGNLAGLIVTAVLAGAGFMFFNVSI